MPSKDPLATLERYRQIGARESVKVLDLGRQVLGDGSNGARVKAKSLGDSEWSIREQVAIAALDLGDIAYAEEQISRLSYRFRSSPRLRILQGMLLEAKGDYAGARTIYEQLLKEDECNVSAHQRMITLSLYTPMVSSVAEAASPIPLKTQPSIPTPSSSAVTRTIPLLVSYLTTFQTDPPAWSLLSDLYVLLSGYDWAPSSRPFDWVLAEKRLAGKGKEVASTAGKGKYLGQAMSCLGQRMMLEPWNWMCMMRYGEVALMAGDVPLAYKTFLRAVEVATDPSDVESGRGSFSGSASDDLDTILNESGTMTRLWWWLKICTIQLRNPSYNPPATSQVTSGSVELVEAVDDLVDERLHDLVGGDRAKVALSALEGSLR